MSIPNDQRIDPRAIVSPLALISVGCSIGPGAVVGNGVALESNVVVGPNVVFVEPASADVQPTQVRERVRIGGGAVVHAGLVLAAGAEVRPGAVVTRSVPTAAIVEGNPAAIVGYAATTSAPGADRLAWHSDSRATSVEATVVRGVTLHRFAVVPDLRGNLTVGEFGSQIPFVPRRYFMVFGVPSRETRGEHAHRQCHQFLICVRGSCAVVADDGQQRIEVLLDDPSRGIYLPPMTWGIQYRYSADALLLVFASHLYDAADYVRDHDEFLDALRRDATRNGGPPP